MREIKTVALIGLGAIGSFLASNLQRVLGENLRIVAGGARKERLERDGIVVNGVPFHFRVVAPEEETGYADLAIVITKITGLSQALEDMRRQIGPDTIIMSPLNGVESEERVAAVYGWDRVLYSLARVSVVMDGNQVSYNSSRASIEFGEKYNQEPSDRVLAVKRLLESAGIRPIIQPDMEIRVQRQRKPGWRSAPHPLRRVERQRTRQRPPSDGCQRGHRYRPPKRHRHR